MKPRNAEAARLEADYLARVKAAIAGREASEVDEILDSLREHIGEELSEATGDQVSLVQMANVLEQLGPPEDYAQEDAVGRQAEVESPANSDQQRPKFSRLAIASVLCLPGAALAGALGQASAPRGMEGIPCLSVLLTGVILGIVALVEIRNSPRMLRGRTLAWIAVIVPPAMFIVGIAARIAILLALPP